MTEASKNPWAPEGWDADGESARDTQAITPPASTPISPENNPGFFQPSVGVPATPPHDEITVVSEQVAVDETVLSQITLQPSRASAPIALIPRVGTSTRAVPSFDELVEEGKRRVLAQPSIPPVAPAVDVNSSDSFSRSSAPSGLGSSGSQAILVDIPSQGTATGWVLRGASVEERPLVATDYILGRVPANPTPSVAAVLVTVTESSGTVSRTHARLSFAGGVWSVTDLNSTNGVSVVDDRGREVPLPAGGTAPVSGRFFIGDAELELVGSL